jgi:hypothetical protein
MKSIIPPLPGPLKTWNNTSSLFYTDGLTERTCGFETISLSTGVQLDTFLRGRHLESFHEDQRIWFSRATKDFLGFLRPHDCANNFVSQSTRPRSRSDNPTADQHW